MNKFKIGDKVHTIGNPEWGLEPMIVKDINGYLIGCEHPTLKKGAFSVKELVRFSQKRQTQLDVISNLKKCITILKEELFWNGVDKQ